MSKQWDAQEICRKAEEAGKAYGGDLDMRFAYEAGVLRGSVRDLCADIRNAQHCPDYLLPSDHETLIKLLEAAKRVASEMESELDMSEVLDGLDECLIYAERTEPKRRERDYDREEA